MTKRKREQGEESFLNDEESKRERRKAQKRESKRRRRAKRSAEERERVNETRREQYAKENVDRFKEFEHNINESVELFYVNSGADRFEDADKIDEPNFDPKNLIDEINDEKLTDKEINQITEEFIRSQGRSSNLLACGACGVRDYEETAVRGKYANVNVKELTILKLVDNGSNLGSDYCKTQRSLNSFHASIAVLFLHGR